MGLAWGLCGTTLVETFHFTGKQTEVREGEICLQSHCKSAGRAQTGTQHFQILARVLCRAGAPLSPITRTRAPTHTRTFVRAHIPIPEICTLVTHAAHADPDWETCPCPSLCFRAGVSNVYS